MPDFKLPHEHGNTNGSLKFHKELSNISKFATAADFFKVLSDSTRVRIFWLLSHREECVVNISALLNMSSPAISHHLRLLTESGLIESRREGKEVYYRAADSEQGELLHKILEQVMEVTCPVNADATGTTPEEIVRTVHAYLMEHLSERITIDELSKKFSINTTTLKQAFKKVYGTSIATHMNEHRMKHAAKLLLETDDSIASVSMAVGYESQSKFSAGFKTFYGILPSEYRKK